MKRKKKKENILLSEGIESVTFEGAKQEQTI